MFPLNTWNKHQDILNNKDITNNRCEGFNHGWTQSMSTNPSLYVVLEGFLQQESWAKKTIREDHLAVGGTEVQNHRNRNLLKEQRRQDLKALCLSYESQMPKDYMDSLVRFFD